MITAPTATFANVAAAPRPFGILFVCALLIGLGTAAPQFTETGRQAALDMNTRNMERMGMTVTPELQAQMAAAQQALMQQQQAQGQQAAERRLRQLPEVGTDHHADARIAARGLRVAHQDDRLARRRHLQRARNDARRQHVAASLALELGAGQAADFDGPFIPSAPPGPA